MTNRERFQAVLRGRPMERMPMVEWASWWPETVKQWRKEGLFPQLDGPTLADYWGLDPPDPAGDRGAPLRLLRPAGAAPPHQPRPGGLLPPDHRGGLPGVFPGFRHPGGGYAYNHACYDEFIAPYYRQVIPALAERGVPVLIDTDGDVEPMIPWFRECGLSSVLPLERQAGGGRGTPTGSCWGATTRR